MNIPNKDVVSYVLAETLRGRHIKSQAELARLLNKRFRKNGSKYRVSPVRVREIAIQQKGIRVRVATRKGRQPKKCPVCAGSLKKTHSRNLKGRKVLAGLKCSRCPYKGSSGKWVPSRYEFMGPGRH
jgi:uncharacterized protein with PIN domain